MNNPLVSIIIPVFNAENTLTKCMKSILDQSYQNIQVILINDGSTDNSAAICDKYSSKDKRVTSIHTLNNGVSHARNCGMSVAEGDYICFVDSDDWIKKDYVEKLVKYIIEHNVDMVMCGWKENETVFSECPKEKEYLILSNLEVLSKFFSEFSGHCFALWNKMFKKEYVDRFDESISYLEDGIFVCRYLKKIKNICIINEPLYQYSLSEESLTRSLKPTPKRLSAFEGRKKMIDLVSQWKEIQKLAKAHYNETVRWILFSSYLNGFYEEIKPYIPEISRYSKEFFSIKTLSFKLKIRYWGYGFIVKHNIGVGIAKIWESLRKYS